MDETYIINGLKEKNKIIFDFVFNYYYTGLCAFANQWVNNRDVAEDLVQEFFVRLWINGPSLQIEHSLKSYLFTSIKNKALDFLKHEKVKEKYQSKFIKLPNDAESYQDWEIAESELRDLIEDALQKLPPKCREIFILSRFEGKSNQKIADKFGISKRTVEVQISNALKQLRAELKEYLPAIILAYLLH